MTVTLEFMNGFTPQERAQVEARSAELIEENRARLPQSGRKKGGVPMPVDAEKPGDAEGAK